MLKRITEHTPRKIYHFYDERNGGSSRASMLRDLKYADVLAKPAYSQFVGHAAVVVYGGKRHQRKAERIIFGNVL